MRLPVLLSLSLACAIPRAGAADFNGDGTGDIAVFRPDAGLWSVRATSRFYLGSSADAPVPGDYAGNGTDLAAVFRPAEGLWSVRGLTRSYFGGSADTPAIGDYDGDGTEEIGVFQAANGLWASPGLTRTCFGASADEPLPPGKGDSPQRTNLLRTGQVESYHSGDDGAYRKGRSPGYADNPDGTVTDSATGLVWAKDGDEAGCNFGAQTDWDAAIDWAEGLDFAEQTDWRLPNRIELMSLVDHGAHQPSIDVAHFPHAKSSNYWSSTTFAYETGSAFVVIFDVGSTGAFNKQSAYCVRAVRGGR